MDSEIKQIWRDDFNAKKRCDYCGNPKRVILRAIVMPIFDIDNKIVDIVMARKCKKCCKEADL